MTGRAIVRTTLGKAWCKNLESRLGDARMSRGRTYARRGSIVDLWFEEGRIHAAVKGRRLYHVLIRVDSISTPRWEEIRQSLGGEIGALLEIEEGRLSDGLLEAIARPGKGLLPARSELHPSCTCPDWVPMCKHAAAVLHGAGARLDDSPEQLLVLRGVDPNDLLAMSRLDVPPQPRAGRRLDVDDLSALFGVDIEVSGPDTIDAEELTERVVNQLADGDATSQALARALGFAEERVLTELCELEAMGMVYRTAPGPRARWMLG